ncbi:MAG: UDP-N-acetylglucosamine--N-acetylmuramyl-(pentapeptide) pyrophosphoryl-undecaprenol N-acetylglucosamine transferase [Verrucomicrobia bacterium]|nr:UDP-N-acetylglucosamine--N-acetylmuramyl-(pentapeptide) pyrophosphoryl-undecaprenol N-acetylglucosamine transferase [Verrucomicrobiota bacterium]MDA1066603.1 UDP-N-acetylglucosamine--N-acetylmuramyl-(pentapeptide) pyrophosphoryl-undecaprenol N-acetylglucosamine transferase [Verrucomicrobiota bacterium]
MAKILIVCGGTGGHLTPGIAIAEELTLRRHHCTLVVSRKKVDSRLIRNYPMMEFIEAPGAPFAWRPVALVRFIWVQITAFIFALRLLSQKKPDLILGFGGFVSAGIALPGCMKGIPFALHEANRVVGRSNRLLSRFASKIFLPKGVVFRGIQISKIQYAGLPLRKEFVPMIKETARELLGISPSGKLLVVFGGSQGASSLNNWAKDNAKALAERGISIYCLIGMNKDIPIETDFDTASWGVVKAWYVPFSDNMPAVLSAADLVVSRAGAGSIGEIIRCRVPSVLVPYPFARDDHQSANAEYVARQDAAHVLEDSQLDSLFDLVIRLLFEESENKRLKENLNSMDLPEEAILIADALEDLIPVKLERSTATTLPSREV